MKKRKKSALSIALALVLMLSITPFAGRAAFAADEFEYELDESDNATITGYLGKAVLL